MTGMSMAQVMAVARHLHPGTWWDDTATRPEVEGLRGLYLREAERVLQVARAAGGQEAKPGDLAYGECPECHSQDRAEREYPIPSPVNGRDVSHTCEHDWHDSDVPPATAAGGQAAMIERACDWKNFPQNVDHRSFHFGHLCPYEVCAALLRGEPDPRRAAGEQEEPTEATTCPCGHPRIRATSRATSTSS